MLILCLLAACTSPLPDDTDPVETLDSGDTGEVETDPGSVCASTETAVRCPYQTTELMTGVTGLVQRDVHHQVPAGDPPAAGWPVVVLYQGSYMPAALYFQADESTAFGGLHQARLTRDLLDAGFAVLAPEAHLDGTTYWDTNIQPYATAWETAPDHYFVLDILEGIAAGTFGELDRSRLYAAGISSGGYMTSRMAEAYPGEFTALAIQSASWCWCGALGCLLPDELPADHPPTLFLHGEQDTVVPISQMRPYAEALQGQGTPVEVVADPEVGHQWLEAAPVEILAHFQEHP